MLRVDQKRHAVDGRVGEMPPLLLLAIPVAMVALLVLAFAAAYSGGLDRLLPENELFVPYFTT
jgi:hypothetical protein